jgi:hypothetical protein
LEPKYAAENEKLDITKPPREEFEMRVIVWETKEIKKFMDPVE